MVTNLIRSSCSNNSYFQLHNSTHRTLGKTWSLLFEGSRQLGMRSVVRTLVSLEQAEKDQIRAARKVQKPKKWEGLVFWKTFASLENYNSQQ